MRPLVLLLLLAACAPVETAAVTTITPVTSPDQRVSFPPGMANPASQNCLTLGGTLKISETATGQTGLCTLPGGAVIEEWQLYRETHPAG